MNRMPTKEEIDGATKMVQDYLRKDSNFNFIQMAVAGEFMGEFFSAAQKEGWPIFDPIFPELLRAIALLLSELHTRTEK